MGEYEDRKDYASGALDGAGTSMRDLLETWLSEARESDPDDYNAMTLSTVDGKGHPDARIVLLRDVDREGTGFLFYTNYRSAKGRQLTANPAAALTFFWPSLERQLRVRGRVEPLTPEESDRYFHSRPRPSRVGAWASQQSEEIEDRAALESARDGMEAQFPDDVPRPDHWGRLSPRRRCRGVLAGPPRTASRPNPHIRQGDGWTQVRLQP